MSRFFLPCFGTVETMSSEFSVVVMGDLVNPLDAKSERSFAETCGLIYALRTHIASQQARLVKARAQMVKAYGVDIDWFDQKEKESVRLAKAVGVAPIDLLKLIVSSKGKEVDKAADADA